MSSNHLEELVKEFYEYNGYFVRTNIKVDKRKEGGYNGELDILAYHPNLKELLHIECSMDAKSWEERKLIAEKKFQMSLEDYRRLIPFEFNEPKKMFIIGLNKKQGQIDMPKGVEIKNLNIFIKEVYDTVKSNITSEIVPESYPLLRTIQFVKWSIRIMHLDLSFLIKVGSMLNPVS